jgi:hypothetical protein
MARRGREIAVSENACHAEGREFESLQPLFTEALHIAGLSSFWGMVSPTGLVLMATARGYRLAWDKAA